jgi:hypothetical protein
MLKPIRVDCLNVSDPIHRLNNVETVIGYQSASFPMYTYALYTYIVRSKLELPIDESLCTLYSHFLTYQEDYNLC